MQIIKTTYNFDEMVEQDINTAPSLDIPDLVTEKYYVPQDQSKYMLFLANVKKQSCPDVCPLCGERNSLKYSGRSDPRTIHDVIKNNYRVDIVIQPARIQCTKCRQRFTVPIRGIDTSHPMTTRLIEFLKEECFLQPHTVLAARSGVSVETIRNIMMEEIRKMDDYREKHSLSAPRVLGIDEKHINNMMRGTIVDVENGLLLDMLEDNKQETMKKAIMRLKDWDTKIEVVTTDMNNAYLSWLPDFLPNATIVIDKYHVIQDIEKRISTTKNELYNYRKAIMYQTEDIDEKMRQQQVLSILNKNKRLLNYSMENITRSSKLELGAKLDTVMEEFPEFMLLRKLYYLIELMYLQESYQHAVSIWREWEALLPPDNTQQYKEWCDLYSVEPPMFNEFRSFSRVGFQTFEPYILNYFLPGCRYTNAATEGLNRLIGGINSAGNGCSFKVLRAKALYASLVHERRLYGIDIKTIPRWKPTG